MKFRLLEKDKLHLTQHIASCRLGNKNYELSITIPSNSPIIEYEGERAILEITDIVMAGIAFIEKTKESK